MLKYGILELLSRTPLTGYDLWKRFRGSLMFCWHANHSQIYPQLKKMEADGLVVSRLEFQEGKPNRRVFKVTEKGLRELADWQKSPPRKLEYKDELLLRLFAIDLMEVEDSIHLIQQAKRLHYERLTTLESISRMMEEKFGPIEELQNNSMFGPYLCIKQDISREEAFVRWCDWSVGQIRARAGTAASRQMDQKRIDLELFVNDMTDLVGK